MRDSIDFYYREKTDSSFLTKVMVSYSSILILFFVLLFIVDVTTDFVYRNLSFDIIEQLEVTEEENDINNNSEANTDETLSYLENKDSQSENTGNIIKEVVKFGDNFTKILFRNNITGNDYSKLISEIKSTNQKINLKPGQILTFVYSDNKSDSTTKNLEEIIIEIDNISKLQISKLDDSYSIKKITQNLKKTFVKHEIEISGSFASSLKKLGIKYSTINDLSNSFNNLVNINKSIKPGDKITLITEKFFTEDDKFSHTGKVVYASLTNSGKEYNLYWYKHDGTMRYFHEDGKILSKSLLGRPLSKVVVSSKFGKRRHPILGVYIMHTGVDFAARKGTPIMSAGDGVVTYVGHKGGYGKYIEVKHTGKISTAYAHAHQFAKNIKTGTRVKKGQIIAYVGNTGRSTGPHLHYEVKINGKYVNPLSIKTIDSPTLLPKNMMDFDNHKLKIKRLLAELKNDIPVEDLLAKL